jgi:hypothetical protein
MKECDLEKNRKKESSNLEFYDGEIHVTSLNSESKRNGEQIRVFFIPIHVAQRNWSKPSEYKSIF